MVDVVGHEHETEQVPTEPPDRLLQSLEQTLAVTLVLEDGSPEDKGGSERRPVIERIGVEPPARTPHAKAG
jgi:hypothetical protein